MPYAASTPPSGQASTSTQSQDNAIPIPLDALLTPTSPTDRGRKRPLEQEDGDIRPVKGPRLSTEGGQYSRFRRGSWAQDGRGGSRMMMSGRPDFMDGGMNSGMDLGTNGGMMGNRGGYRSSERRGICRDYHSESYCSLQITRS